MSLGRTKKNFLKSLAGVIFCMAVTGTQAMLLYAEEEMPKEAIETDNLNQMATGWRQTEGEWHYIKEDGTPYLGWLSLDGRWYFLNSSGVMLTGWQEIDGKYYYLREDGSMETGSRKEEDTIYTFHPENGSLSYAKKAKNTGGGRFDIGFYSKESQELADCLNELKSDDFDRDEDDDYYEDDKVDYDKDASFIISGRLTEIAQHRLSMARNQGYGNGKIPGEGGLLDYLKSINYNSARRSMEVYLKNCDGADGAENKLLRSHSNSEKKRKDQATYYKEIGIAHEKVSGKDYYMVIFMR